MPKTINFANDLGNGSIKGTFLSSKSEDSLIIPSTIARKKPNSSQNPIKLSEISTKEKNDYVKNIFNILDVSVQSQAIEQEGRFLIGKAAIDSNLRNTEFDVNDGSGKSETDLSVILTLSVIAGKALQDNYLENEELSQQINVDVNMVTALPVQEGTTQNTNDKYSEKYLNNDHIVTIKNFDKLITVNIHFNRVVVALEGETAQYFIKSNDSNITARIEKELNKSYPELINRISTEEIINLKNTIGIDIGEGTTDFVVFKNNDINIPNSSSLSKGYGNVLENAIETLHNQKFSVDNRVQIKELLETEINGLNRSRIEKVKEVVSDQIDELTQDITYKFSKILSNVHGNIEIIYVYGGGSTPLKDILKDELSNKVKEFTSGIDIPIIFIDEKYSQVLNEKGLTLILKTLFKDE